jgi:hypothetical protein
VVLVFAPLFKDSFSRRIFHMKCQARLVGYFFLCGGVIALMSASGCGGSSAAAKTQKVSGKVTTTDGAPAKGVGVSFTGTGSKAFQSSGTTGDDGTYQLSTFDTNDGAPEGDYSVGISDASGALEIVEGETKVTVKAGSNTFDYKVKPGAAAAPATDAAPAGETP